MLFVTVSSQSIEVSGLCIQVSSEVSSLSLQVSSQVSCESAIESLFKWHCIWISCFHSCVNSVLGSQVQAECQNDHFCDSSLSKVKVSSVQFGWLHSTVDWQVKLPSTFTDSVDRSLTLILLQKQLFQKHWQGKKIQRQEISNCFNFSNFDSWLKGEKCPVISVKYATATFGRLRDERL